jgi:flagellar hook assembly protein FlgD
MKTSFKTIIVAFAFVTSFAFAANAEDKKETKKSSALNTGVYINKEGKINVLVDQLNNASNTTLLIRNETGQVVYREIIEKGNQKFGRVLNVEELSAGTYQIEVSSKNDSQIKSFQLSEPQTERTIAIN